jgi:hypothetical protein
MSSTNIPTILFPEGNGGNWLNNLIYHLEENDNSFPSVIANSAFDREKKSKNVYMTHGRDGMCIDEKVTDNRILFSTTKSFNIFLNITSKKVLNRHMLFGPSIVADMSFNEQFEFLTNHVVYILSNKEYKDWYYKNINLNYDLLFINPEIFILNLFDTLDKVGLTYHKNKKYCMQSIENYKKTLQNPSDHVGQPNSLIWAAWCHAIAVIYNVHIDGSLLDCTSLTQVSKILHPYQDKFLEISQPFILTWN